MARRQFAFEYAWRHQKKYDWLKRNGTFVDVVNNKDNKMHGGVIYELESENDMKHFYYRTSKTNGNKTEFGGSWLALLGIAVILAILLRRDDVPQIVRAIFSLRL
jgi:hypothetical protein